MVKISTEIGSIAKLIGEYKAIECVAKAGFDAYDLTLTNMYQWSSSQGRRVLSDHPVSGAEYLKFVRGLKKVADDYGIKCNQSHAPFPTIYVERSHLKRVIECTAEVGGDICIIHPWNDYTPQQNAEIYFDLLPFAKDCGVKIATENMWNPSPNEGEVSPAACSSAQSFKAHLDAVCDEYFVACVDVGHAEMKGLNTSAVEIIKALGDKVKALHLHDNDKAYDLHLLPFSAMIDFDAILKALKDVNYRGYFTLEANGYLASRGYSAENVFEGVKEMARVAKKLQLDYDNI